MLCTGPAYIAKTTLVNYRQLEQTHLEEQAETPSANKLKQTGLALNTPAVDGACLKVDAVELVKACPGSRGGQALEELCHC